MGKFRSRPRSAPDLAVAIRDAREQQGISQSDLAERIGAPRSWVSQFENGKASSASLGRVFQMLNALGVDVEVSYAFRDTSETASPAKSELQRNLRGGKLNCEIWLFVADLLLSLLSTFKMLKSCRIPLQNMQDCSMVWIRLRYQRLRMRVASTKNLLQVILCLPKRF